MKKLLLVLSMLFIGVQTFSFSPGNVKGNSTIVSPSNLSAMTLTEFLNLSPKKYYELTGKKMTLKQRISFRILKSKLKKQLAEGDKPAAKKTDIGLLSLIFGGGAFVLALIPYLGIVSIPLAIAAIILGIIGLGRKKGDTKSIIGLVLGSLFLLLIVAVIAAFASGGWY